MPAPASPFVREMLGLTLEQRQQFLDSLPSPIRRRLRFNWELWARPGQLWRPGPETFTVYLCGRGYGKSRTGSEAVRYVAQHPELCGGVIGIAGRTANEVNRTMVHGDSGIMACTPQLERPRHYKSDKILAWKNGVIARLFSGEEPESFRGPNIGFLWADELAHWTYLHEAWGIAKYVLRLGEHVRAVITTTPIGVEEVERLVWTFGDDDQPLIASDDTPATRVLQGYEVRRGVRVVEGDTYENAANLAPNFLEEIVSANEGTAHADQEIRGKILRDVPSALWRHADIRRMDELPDDVDLVVVAVDPAGSHKTPARQARALRKGGKPAETGIVVLALGSAGMVYILEDSSGAFSSAEVAGGKIWDAATRWDADIIACEDNKGGDLVETWLRTTKPKKSRALVKRVTATRDKAARAELVTPLYQVGRVRHCGSPRKFVALERQLTTWDRTKPEGSQPSPDRMDALVWGMLYVLNGGSDRQKIRALGSKETWAGVAAEMARRYGKLTG